MEPSYYFWDSMIQPPTIIDLLHMNGVPLGKRDFMGQLRLKNLG